ncbi:hypothetical protein [Bradyrhizobium sp. LTSP857]|jgi:hypothetical protein|uniref:hypothetical protein n=1 Tax=Bradyrhizobium sp. LTSP857 TaxID=1619231 RepID=UPI0005D2757D|nr:hypothetical protein [Bradyrhizobium sp. LTSP857]
MQDIITMNDIITAQLAANEKLLADLIHSGRIDATSAAKHMSDGEKAAAAGIVMELRVLDLA